MKLVVLVLVALLVAAPSAAARDRASALEQWLSIRDAAGVPSGWTGSVAGCAVGTESPASITATLSAVNGLRAFAGLAPVTFDPLLNAEALGAALAVQGCPAGATGRSLLASGWSGADAMLSYAAALPQRLFLLDRAAVVFGAGSTGGANALLFASGVRGAGSGPAVVSWPPAGWVPSALVPDEWSAEFPVGTDLTGANVSAVVDGEPRAVSGVRVLTDGYGGPALAWKLALPPGDHVVDIVAAGTSYRVQTFLADTPLPVTVRTDRSGNVVTVSWDAAVARGVPVTGYRVQVPGALDVVLDADARSTTFTTTANGASIRVTPLSRAGIPRVVGTYVAWTVAGGDGGCTPGTAGCGANGDCVGGGSDCVPNGGGCAATGTCGPSTGCSDAASDTDDGGCGACAAGGCPATLGPSARPATSVLGGGVTASSPIFTRAVRIKGRPRPGSRLVADVRVRNATSIRYQWLRDGRTIRGATRRTYTVRRADRRHRIRLRVTAIGTTKLVRTTSAQRIA